MGDDTDTLVKSCHTEDSTPSFNDFIEQNHFQIDLEGGLETFLTHFAACVYLYVVIPRRVYGLHTFFPPLENKKVIMGLLLLTDWHTILPTQVKCCGSKMCSLHVEANRWQPGAGANSSG